jgi:hypothetical protein
MPETSGRRSRRLLTVVMFLLASSGCAALEDLGYQPNPNATGLRDLFVRPSPEQAARWAIDPHNADRRFRGTALLAAAPFAGDDEYLALFVDNARDPDPAVRAAAIRGVANHGSPEHIEILAGALADPDDLVRAAAARAAQRIHGPSIVPALIQRLDPERERVHEVRAAAAHALGQYAEPRVIEALLAALRDPSLTVNRHARESLTTLTGEELGLDPVAWLAFVRASPDPLAGRTDYEYQRFSRSMRLVDYVPLYPSPPNEPAAQPIGLPRAER